MTSFIVTHCRDVGAPLARPALSAALGAALVAWCPQSAQALDRYTWNARPLVVFAGSEDSAELARQKAIVSDARGGFAERDIVVVYIVGDSVTAELGPGPEMTAAALRIRLGVAAGTFRAVLVGKDGGAKLSASKPILAKRLFATIDAMPMRREEMRQNR
ncbi:MAG: DUF4174 domain-containing protein [Hyphomicrobium sp.]|nr:DUF4174 domain-containing protein [Hyphomicrobium sp.]